MAAVTDETVVYNASHNEVSAQPSVGHRDLLGKLDTGKLAGIVIGVLGGLAIIFTLVSVVLLSPF